MGPGPGDSAERESEPTRESWSAQRARLLEALRERQALVERLSRLQRAIADGDAIDSVLEAVLEGCGHTPTWDDPERVAGLLLEASAVPQRRRGPVAGAP